MKKTAFLLSIIILLLNGCKKPDNDSASIQPSISIKTDSVPFDPLKQRGMIFLPTEEYNNLPLYEINTKGGGRLSTDSPIELEMPPVDNQGDENSCNTWAAGYAIRSYLYHIEKGTSYYYPASTARNSRMVFSPRFLYNTVLRNNASSGSAIKDDGCFFVDCFKVMASTGICTLEDMPYVQKHFADEVSAAQSEAASHYKLVDWKRFPIDEVKIIAALQRKIPVAIGIWTDDHFDHPKSYPNDMIDKEYIWRSYGQADGIGHGVVIFGYDENKKAFKVMNSWGNGWANKGWIWMDHSLFSTTTIINGKTEKVIKEAYVGVNSLNDIVPVTTAPTGKIDVSYACDEKQYRLPNGDPNLGTYRYKFLIHNDIAYDNDLEKYLCLITPDKNFYYKIDVSSSAKSDGKTFSGEIIYTPKSSRTSYNPISGEFIASPYYLAYDIKDILSGYDTRSVSYDNDINFTPIGTYEFIFMIKTKDGKLISSKRMAFEKPFFDISSCNGVSTPDKKLYTVDF